MPVRSEECGRQVRFLSQNRPGPRMGMGHYERLLLRSLIASGAPKEGWRFDIRFAGRPPSGGLRPDDLEPGLTGAVFEGYSPARLAALPWPAARAAINRVNWQPLPGWTRQAACSARAILTPSEFAKQELMELLGLPDERIHVVPNGYERDVFHPAVAAADDEILSHYGISGPFLLYSGGFTRRKNVRALLEAWAQTAPRYPGLTLALAGPTAPLEALAARTPAPRVVVVGYLERNLLPRVLKAATAMVYPSVYDGFGLPPLEAMALGVPIVAVRQGAVPEVVGDCAVLAEDGTAESLAAAMQFLLDDSARTKVMSARGPARANGFSWEAYALRVLEIYREVIAA